jgi:hypothetical protein
MYSIFNKEERDQFRRETDIDIRVKGEHYTFGSVVNYFEVIVKDSIKTTEEFPIFSGCYTINYAQLLLTKLTVIGCELIEDSPGLQKLIAEITLEKLLSLAKDHKCNQMAVHTENIIFVEEMFKQKFQMIRLVGPNYEVRAEKRL